MTDQTPIIPTIRHDGWTQARTARYLDHLANHGSVSAACAHVGMSREAAYRRRRRDAVFVRSWNAALLLAREASAEVLASRAIDGVEEEIWYRGELVGTRRKYDSRLLLAHMARLDKAAEEDGASQDARRFDELVALACGEVAPDELLLRDSEGLPFSRSDTARFAAEEARCDLHQAWLAGEDGRAKRLDTMALSPEQRTDAEIAEAMEHDSDCMAEAIREGRAAVVVWDRWRQFAWAQVDRLLSPRPGASDADDDAGSTLSDSSTSPAEAAAMEEPDGAPAPAQASAAPEPDVPEREPRYEDFVPSPTSWRDYCEARKRYHQKKLAERRGSQP
jgi:hypothetical protein